MGWLKRSTLSYIPCIVNAPQVISLASGIFDFDLRIGWNEVLATWQPD